MERPYFIFLFGVLSVSIWVGLSEWILKSKGRPQCFLERYFTLPILLMGIFIVKNLFFPLVPSKYFFPFILPIIISFYFFIPWKVPPKFFLLIFALSFSVYSLEAVFQFFLIDHKVPVTEKGFQKYVVSTWPHPITPERPEGTYRILGLADSFGVVGGRSENGNIIFDQNYHYLLEKRLRHHYPNVEIINISGGGFNLYDELDILKRFGERYNPDLILHGFYVQNDFDTNKGLLMDYKNFLFRLPDCSVVCRLQSMQFGKVIRMWFKWKMNDTLRKEELEQGYEAGTFSEKYYDKVTGKNHLRLCEEEPDAAIWGVADKIRDEAEKIGVEYAMIIHPAQIQVDEKWRKNMIQKHGKKDKNYSNCTLPQQRIRKYCESNNISCLDLLPTFQKAGREQDVYLLRDTHYNELGNAIAAEAIEYFIRNKGYLSSLSQAVSTPKLSGIKF